MSMVTSKLSLMRRVALQPTRQLTKLHYQRNLTSIQRLLYSNTATTSTTTTPAAQPFGRGRRRRSFRSRFKRRLLFYGSIIGIWVYFTDADLVTYFYDLYRVRYLQKEECFKNQTLWIIGASSGIGETLVYEAAKNQAKKIIISARREKELQRVKATCNKFYNRNCEIVVQPLDVLDFISEPKPPQAPAVPIEIEEDAVVAIPGSIPPPSTPSQSLTEQNDSYIKSLLDKNGDIDILILNTGLTQTSYATDTDIDVLKYVSNLNIFSQCAIASSMIRSWKSNKYINNSIKSNKNRKTHSIAITSSLAGLMGSPQKSCYSMSKHAINGYFESLRMEHHSDNINVNIICPGPTQKTQSSLKAIGSDTSPESQRERGVGLSNHMNTQRCAQLYCTAIASDIKQAWISPQPWLVVTYLRQYLPVVFNFGAQYLTPLMMEERN